MSTRAVIARVEGDGWRGRYQHSDGYPTHLGRNLWRIWHEEYGGDTARLLREVVDAHPAGWSYYNGAHDQACYCHPERACSPDMEEYVTRWRTGRAPDPETFWITSHGPAAGTQWAYAFGERARTLCVFARRQDRWELLEVFGYADDEPDWEALA